MRDVVNSFITGMSAGAVLSEGNGLKVMTIAVIACGIVNVYCMRRSRLLSKK